MILPVILGGGEGKRLWPLSRQYFPKQLQCLIGKYSLLQQTLQRLAHLDNNFPGLLISNRNYRFMIETQLREINFTPSQTILESQALNTTFTAACAALWAKAEFDNPILLMLPVDHVIEDTEAFCRAILHTEKYLMSQNAQVSMLFGSQPHYPSPHFGYIKANTPIQGVYSVSEFIEKPSEKRALGFINEGGYFWNTGITMFFTNHLIAELERFSPLSLEFAKNVLETAKKENGTLSIQDNLVFPCPNISLDYAIFEKTDSRAMTTFEGKWLDVGNWSTLHEASPKDADQNVKIGDVMTIDTQNCYIRSQTRLIATVGIHNQTIVDTRDALLIVDNQKSHQVTELVNLLLEKGRPEGRFFPLVIKPWGSYEVLFHDLHIQIKKLKINPGACISSQLHKCRSEHWIITSGQASVTKDSRTLILLENQSTHIPVGIKHRLANDTTEPLELIEIQLGSYLGDDDIIRFEDKYARTQNEV
jgi:mannose-1-phosphate guanylyltransferase/mannose-6-phosphate isomerase